MPKNLIRKGAFGVLKGYVPADQRSGVKYLTRTTSHVHSAAGLVDSPKLIPSKTLGHFGYRQNDRDDDVL